MTYRYSDIEPMEALYSRAMKYGIAQLAMKLGMRMDKQLTETALRNKLRPGLATQNVSVPEFSHLIDLLEEGGDANAKMPLRALCWRHQMVAVDLPADADSRSPAELLGQLGSMAKEFGELVREVTQASGDGYINQAERDRIHTEAEQLMVAVVRVCQLVDMAAHRGGAIAQ